MTCAICEQDFVITAGDATSLQFAVTTGAFDSNGVPVPYDLTGTENIQWALSGFPMNPPILTKTMLGGQIAINSPPTAGIFTITLNAVDTEGMPGYYYYEARITDNAGLPRTVARGYATINPSNL